MKDPRDSNPYDLGDVAARMRRLVSERASLAGPLGSEVISLRQELVEVKTQRDALLAACEAEEAVFQHRMGCLDCRWQSGYCPKALALIEQANGLRQGAIAKVKQDD